MAGIATRGQADSRSGFNSQLIITHLQYSNDATKQANRTGLQCLHTRRF